MGDGGGKPNDFERESKWSEEVQSFILLGASDAIMLLEETQHK